MSGLQILLVDDDMISVDVIGTYLRHGGHTVSVAITGEAAVYLVEHQRFDLILMDSNLPGISGSETARRIRALSAEHSQVPIYALSFSDLPAQIAGYLAAGMNGSIVKLTDYETLMAAIKATGISP